MNGSNVNRPIRVRSLADFDTLSDGAYAKIGDYPTGLVTYVHYRDGEVSHVCVSPGRSLTRYFYRHEIEALA